MLNKLLNLYNQHTSKIIFGTGVIMGLLLGLLIAWVLWPVSFTNATPEMLRQDFRDDYLAWVAREYVATSDVEQARLRLGTELWKKGDPVAALDDLAQRRGGEDATNLQALAQALSAPVATETQPGGEGEQLSILQRAKPVLQICGAGLIAAALGGLLYLLVARMRSSRVTAPGRAATSHAELTTAIWEETAPPLTQFKTTYSLGDDFYDPSFSIEQPTGEFMGECGVGISETIGVGDPKKVTAMEVWVFDKNDIRTVTRVLMSEHAFQDMALRDRLTDKDSEHSPTLAQEGTELILETATLLLRARVAGLEYGTGQLPSDSFFQRITIEIGVWAKPGTEAPVADLSPA